MYTNRSCDITHRLTHAHKLTHTHTLIESLGVVINKLCTIEFNTYTHISQSVSQTAGAADAAERAATPPSTRVQNILRHSLADKSTRFTMDLWGRSGVEERGNGCERE